MDWHARVRELLGEVTGDASQDAGIQRELADHLADREEELRAAGLSDREIDARLTRELLATRARRLAPAPARRTLMRTLTESADDLRYGARLLRRQPGFTAVALVTLALAIGATTAIFSVARGVLLRPLPYPSPDQIVLVWEVNPDGTERNVVSPGNYLDWRDRAQSFSAIGALSSSFDVAMTGSGDPLKVTAARIAPSLLDVLRVRSALGRAFGEADGLENAASVALLSHRFWRDRFGSDPGIVGRMLTIDGIGVEVAGVMPDGFDFPSPDTDVLFNMRFSEAQRAERRSHNFVVVARLADGVSVGQANAEMQAIAARLAEEHPADMQGWGVKVVELHGDTVRTARPLILALGGVVAAVLLIACANLANLQLARAARRGQEIAIRAAIGAGRGRVLRQMLTETLLLAAAGGALGVAVATGAVRALVAAAPPGIPYLDRVGIDGLVLAAAAAVTLVSALAIGLAPALRAGRCDLRGALQATRFRPDRSQQRMRQALVVAQVSLALVLLVGAGLFIRSFRALNRVDPGFDPAGVLTVSIDLPRARYGDQSAQRQFYQQVIERLSVNPRVERAAGTTAVPGAGASMTFSFAIEGRPSGNPSGRENAVPLQGVTGDYFSAMRIPIVAGRAFDAGDHPDAAPRVIINEALARRHWPGGGAVGSRINFRPGQLPWAEIVGIVGDTRDEGLAAEAPPTIYVPFAQRAATWGWMTWQTLVVRARDGAAESLVPEVRAAIWAVDPNLPLLDVATVDGRLAENEARRRLAGTLIGAFAIVALLLGTIGIHGVMSYAVAEQRQEIGVRIALGAVPRAVAGRVIARGTALAAGGIAIGLAAAALLTRALETLLYGVTPLDVPTFAATSALLLGVASLAAWLPARRASRIDPIVVLRER